METTTQIVLPVFALAFWTMLMWLWMYATRIPAIMTMKLKLDPDAPRGEQMSLLPPEVRWKADNYNHLMEQPTVFYALIISLSLVGAGNGINLILAWAYVVLRILHSLVQVLNNKIELRFIVFVLSNIPLFWLSINAMILLIEQL